MFAEQRKSKKLLLLFSRDLYREKCCLILTYSHSLWGKRKGGEEEGGMGEHCLTFLPRG